MPLYGHPAREITMVHTKGAAAKSHFAAAPRYKSPWGIFDIRLRRSIDPKHSRYTGASVLIGLFEKASNTNGF